MYRIGQYSVKTLSWLLEIIYRRNNEVALFSFLKITENVGKHELVFSKDFIETDHLKSLKKNLFLEIACLLANNFCWR